MQKLRIGRSALFGTGRQTMALELSYLRTAGERTQVEPHNLYGVSYLHQGAGQVCVKPYPGLAQVWS
jgi:hypothetical protein